MNFNLVSGWIAACLLITSLWCGESNCQEAFAYQRSEQPLSRATTPCSDGCVNCGGRNICHPTYDVPEVRYGANLGFPQFGQVTHGVWYNGPKSGVGQNRKTKPGKCVCKKCKSRRTKPNENGCELSQRQFTDNLEQVLFNAGWEPEQLQKEVPQRATVLGKSFNPLPLRGKSIALKPMPKSQSIRERK